MYIHVYQMFDNYTWREIGSIFALFLILILSSYSRLIHFFVSFKLCTLIIMASRQNNLSVYD